MKCNQHAWEFHAELIDGTIIRWCGKCGGLQTYPRSFKDTKKVEGNTTWQTVLSFEEMAFVKQAPAEIRLPESAKEDDGLFSDGVVDECQPDLRSLYSNQRWSKFKNPWTPDDNGEIVRNERQQAWVDDPTKWADLSELQVLSGVRNINNHKGN